MRYGYYPYSLEQKYTELNARFWGGRLPRAVTRRSELVLGGPEKERGILVQRFWTREEGHPFIRACETDGWGLFHRPTHDLPAKIWVVSTSGGRERETLLHEMVHCALWFAGIPDEGHGPPFVAELERLADEGEEWAREEAEYYGGPGKEG